MAIATLHEPNGQWMTGGYDLRDVLNNEDIL